MNATTTVILGGGFGGIAAANTLRGLAPRDHDIIVVDQTADFLVGAGKTWMMVGERTYPQISRARADLLEPGVRFLQAAVSSIDLTGRTVAAGDATLHWDHLVIALGADFAPGTVPGLAESARTFYTPTGASALHAVLERFAGGEIVMLLPKLPIKCPPAPYEAIMLLHDYFQRRGLADKVRLSFHTVEGAPMQTAGPEMGQFIKDELAQRGIAYHPLRKTLGVDGATRRVIFEDGAAAAYDLLIAIPPHVAPPVVRDAKLTGPGGWIQVDPLTLEVTSAANAPDVYAIGDVMAMTLPGRFKPDVPLSLPKAGVLAAEQGVVVARRIAAKLQGLAAGDVFGGRGFCYLELGAGRAVRAEGAFFELPHPVMQKRLPDEAQWRDKLDWVELQLKPRR